MLKKIKNFYKEHRIFTILMAVVIVCLILIVTILIQCFYVGNGTDKYGNRLENIEKYEIEDSRLKEFETKYEEEKNVSNVEAVITGKIIYIKMTFTGEADLIESESIALKSLDEFSEDEKNFYDFNFTLSKEKTENSDGFLISGAKNRNGSGLVWNNNRMVVEAETTEE